MRLGDLKILAIVGGTLSSIALLAMMPEEPEPATLTETRKRVIVERIQTEVLFGQLLYGLPQVMPPAVAFDLQGANAAESECSHESAKTGGSDWVIHINERIAAQHWQAFIDETLPHEAAHMVLCQVTPDWQAHGVRWESVVRQLGAEPKAFHHYDEET